MSGRFCVYKHVSDGQVFYVGSGAPSRPSSRFNRNTRWRAHVAQFTAYEVQIHARTDDRDEATAIESALVEELKPACNMYAPGRVTSAAPG